jgi:CRISPR-associated protein Cmr6
MTVQIDWRLLSNSGTDEGIIRPVIAAGGWPMIPGSSIKGLFRRACVQHQPDKLNRWCGTPPDRETDSGGSQGILRFHGAWPTDVRWKKRLLDIVHGQQRWQVWDPDRDHNGNGQGWQRRVRHNANAIISLYQPELDISISTSAPDISDAEWALILDTLEKALSLGIGGRTCAGYGYVASTSNTATGSPIFECALEGQGIASTTLSLEEGEFRPNMFRAAIRGMTLRLFGGLCDNNCARKQTGRLFGSIDSLDGGLQRGLLDCRFTNAHVELDRWIHGANRNKKTGHVFAATGTLQWQLTKAEANFADDQLEALVNLLASLHGLIYCLSGFGKSWRRPDHFIFYPDYYTQIPYKPPIGCHWQLHDAAIFSSYPDWAVTSAASLGALISNARSHATAWLERQGVDCGLRSATWREVIDPAFMNVWVRIASDVGDGHAIHWFHREPAINATGRRNPHDLKGSSIAGYVQRDSIEVSRIWNRMLPCCTAGTLQPWLQDPESGLHDNCITAWPGPYLESVVLFADRHGMDPDPAHQQALIASMDADDSPFERVHF